MMKAKHIQLLPSEKDGKRWLAEITDEDETFRLKRDFQPELRDGIWELYDGWYQIHGRVVGVTPFEKEYVRVQDGQMERHLNFPYVLEHLAEIKAYEPERLERVKYQIVRELDDIKAKAPYEPAADAIDHQKDDLDLIENSSQAIEGLTMLIKRKDFMIQEYRKAFENWDREW